VFVGGHLVGNEPEVVKDEVRHRDQHQTTLRRSNIRDDFLPIVFIVTIIEDFKGVIDLESSLASELQ
jgi:hypothetical protein